MLAVVAVPHTDNIRAVVLERKETSLQNGILNFVLLKSVIIK